MQRYFACRIAEKANDIKDVNCSDRKNTFFLRRSEPPALITVVILGASCVVPPCVLDFYRTRFSPKVSLAEQLDFAGFYTQVTQKSLDIIDYNCDESKKLILYMSITE